MKNRKRKQDGLGTLGAIAVVVALTLLIAFGMWSWFAGPCLIYKFE